MEKNGRTAQQLNARETDLFLCAVHVFVVLNLIVVHHAVNN